MLLLASMVAGLLAAEGAVRLWATLVTPNLYAFDDELGWRLRPNLRRWVRVADGQVLVETNALGGRGPLHVGPSEKRRVLVLGDSVAEGMLVSNDELFTVLWERERSDLEVVNAGVTGYSTLQDILVARRLRTSVQPSVCLLMVVSGLDLDANVTPFSPAIGPRPWMDGTTRQRPLDWTLFRPALLPVPGAVWLHRHSLAAYVLQKRLVGLVRGEPAADRWVEHVPEETKWRVLEALVSRLAGEATVVVAGLPTAIQLATGDDGFAPRLGAVARRAGARFLDLGQTLRPEHFAKDGYHWNAAGHRAVAAHLAEVF